MEQHPWIETDGFRRLPEEFRGIVASELPPIDIMRENGSVSFGLDGLNALIAFLGPGYFPRWRFSRVEPTDFVAQMQATIAATFGEQEGN